MGDDLKPCGCVWSIYEAERDALRARAEAAEQRAEAAEADHVRARDLLAECEAALANVRTMHKGERANRLAAEQRAEALAAELAQARADARVLAGYWFGSVGGFFVDVEGLTDAEAEALAAIYEADGLPQEAVLAVIRRALGGAA